MTLTEYIYFGFRIRRARRRKLEKAMGRRSAPVNFLLDIPIPTEWDMFILDFVPYPKPSDFDVFNDELNEDFYQQLLDIDHDE